jgi:hypothetical protein
MCRNIKLLFNFEPPVTPDEVRAACLQFVRKVSGFNKPSQANEAAFSAAVEAIAEASGKLLGSLEMLNNVAPFAERRLAENMGGRIPGRIVALQHPAPAAAVAA